MILGTLFSDPLIFIAWLTAILIVLSVHEFAHAWASHLMGDDTARNQGRLTLNPVSHVSGWGLLMLLFVGFGWGKPVPFNPYNLKNKRLGLAIIAIAGPLSNLLLAIVTGVILHLLVAYNVFLPTNLLIQFLTILVILNVVLMVFNLIPIPPLDGSKLLFAFLRDERYQSLVYLLETRGPMLLLFLLILDNIIGINIFGNFFQGIISFVYKLIF